MALVLFILLFIFIACVKGGEKATIKSNDQKWRIEHDRREDIEKRFMERMIDRDFETQCRDECIYAKSDRYIAKFNEMKEALNWPPSRAEVWVGMMAEKGKLPYKFVRYGFANLIVSSALPSDQAYEMWHRHFNFILWVDDQLKKAGVEERIGICSRAGNDTYWKYFEINECLKDKELYRDIYRRVFSFSFKPIRCGNGRPLTLDPFN